MTTFVGHAATGAAIYLCKKRLDEPQARWALPLFIFLAVAPDLDYLFLWAFKVSFITRISHTIAFCFALSLLAWTLTYKLRQRAEHPPTMLRYMLASSSHLVLDLLVGVHALPLFWPFSSAEIMSPIGILPGAIHIVTVPSYYFWRNLLIECGVLFPVLLLCVVLGHSIPVCFTQAKPLLLGVLWLVCLLSSLSFQR